MLSSFVRRRLRKAPLLEAQEKLARLAPDAEHVTNTNSGHEIHKEQPQLVVDSIRKVVEAVRKENREPPR
jgi:hypothetical protein